MAFFETLTYKEKGLIEEFRKRMKNDLPPDMFEDSLLFHNFLVARDFDVDKAEKMLRKNILWRKSFQVDNILKDFKPKEFFLNYIKSSDVGVDKDGNLVKYAPWGRMDSKDTMKCTTLNNYMKHCIWAAENDIASLKKLKEKTRKESLKMRVIIDLDKLTLGNVTNKESVEQSQRFLRIMQDNYPETLKTVYIINAPTYYVIVFSILKPLMSKAMLEKIQVFGSRGWKEKLLEVIDADVLPAFLGGKRTDPDGNPLCTVFIKHPGKIPEKYYLQKEERDFKDRSQVKQIVVPQKEKIDISVDITESGSLIQWGFLIKNKDIGFGLFKEISEQELEDVLPIQRYDTIGGTEVGSYRCQCTGKYIIVFDNSYSWMRSKEIEYCITVIKPEL